MSKSFLNGVELQKEVKKVIGEKGLRELEEIQKFIKPDHPSSIRSNFFCRDAQSIISRAEASVFNVTIPRFSFRVYLDQEHKSFINVRKVGLLVSQAKKLGANEKKILVKLTCVGDSVLRPSTQLQSEYHVIMTELGLAYGEGKPILGTSFVKHYELIGGLCSQAVCFMATSLMHAHAAHMHGLVEITALAKKINSSSGTINLEGLNQKEVADYFNCKDVGLNSIWQIPHSSCNSLLDEQDMVLQRDHIVAYRNILRSYLLSNVPVVILVDAGREAGYVGKVCPLDYDQAKSVYQLNGLTPDCFSHSNPKEILNHAVLLTGCGKTPETENLFLFNDPMLFPFMKITTEGIFHISPYVDKQMEKVRYPWFLPVTHPDVKMPLSRWRPSDKLYPSLNNVHEDIGQYQGLMRLVLRYQTKFTGADLPDLPLYDEQYYSEGQFRLQRVHSLVYSDKDGYGFLPQHVKKYLQEWYLAHSDKERIPETHWLWIQQKNGAKWKSKRVHALWLWDAQEAPPKLDEIKRDQLFTKLLVGILVWDETFAEVLHYHPRVRMSESLSEIESKDTWLAVDSSPQKLRPSLISSFCTEGIEKASVQWPAGLVNCDLYAFSVQDADLLLGTWQSKLKKRLRSLGISRAHLRNFSRRLFLKGNYFPAIGDIKRIISIQDRMAALYDHSHSISRCAQIIHERMTARQLSIVAFATFLPNIISDGQEGENTEKTLRFLIRLLKQLQGEKHQASVLELVGGSLIDGKLQSTGHCSAERKIRYRAKILSREKSIDAMLDTLRMLVQEEDCEGISFALELEPGPFYTINDLEALKYLCVRLDHDRILSSKVGFNLDVAHWSLAGISPKFLYKSEAKPIIQRIAHVHLSDHGKGHFADVGICQIHDKKYFNEWIGLIDKLSWFNLEKDEKKYPPFSHVVAIELEAVKDVETVISSLNVFRDIYSDNTFFFKENTENSASVSERRQRQKIKDSVKKVWEIQENTDKPIG